jgi:hypothetical protein
MSEVKSALYSEFKMETCEKCGANWCPEEDGVRAVYTKWGVFCEYCIDEARDHAKDDEV